MKLLAALLPVAALAVAAAAHADGGPPPGTIVRLSSATEHLSNATSDWRDVSAGLQMPLAPNNTLDLSIGSTRRFGLNDNEGAASYTFPVGSALTLTADGNASNTHVVLPRYKAGGSLQMKFAHDWLAHVGIHTSSYDAATVNQGSLQIEHYVGDYSWAAGWRPTRAFGKTANGFELRGSRYFGDRNAITLLVATGREAASAPGSVVLTDVRAIALFGSYWLDRHWDLTYGISHTRQGDLYQRNGFNLGVQYAF